MTDITQITQRANARIDELFKAPHRRTIPTLTPGMVRVVLAVAQELELTPPLPEQAAAPPAQPKPSQHPAGKRYGLAPDEFRALVLSEIRRIAGPHGTWVALADFDAARTTQLPTAGGVAKRLKCRWADIVVEALGERATPPDKAGFLHAARRGAVPEAQPAPRPAESFRNGTRA